MYGYPVPEVGFIAQLKFWLGKYYPRRKIKLYNFAKPGNSSYTVWLKIKRTILYKPDLLIVYSGHNEFLLRSTKGISSRLNYLVERSSLSTVRVFRYAWQRFLLWKNRQVYLTEKRTPFAYKSPEYLHKKNLYKVHLENIVALTKKKKVKLLLCTVAWNTKDWPPVYKKIKSRNYQRQAHRLMSLLQEKRITLLKKQWHLFAKQYPKNALSFYVRGKIQLAEKKRRKALASFTLAKELDPFPWRVLREFNSLIRKQESHRHVWVADVEKAFVTKAKDLVGFKLIADNCHPTPHGSGLVAATILNKVASVFLSPTQPRHTCPVDEFLKAVQYQKKYDRPYLFKIALYSAVSPFFHYSISRKLWKAYLKRYANDWKAWANLASLDLLEGKKNEGLKKLRKARELNPKMDVESDDVPYLSAALQRIGGKQR